MADYVLSVGMEVHAELRTASKMFCRCPVAFGGMPNTRVCPVCLGLPGTLPVPNRSAIRMVLRTALALNCQVPAHSVFHRKNYFYPDLPKGYQVSQYGETNPIGYYGWLEIPKADGTTKQIKVQRVHLEEDTGKLMHLPTGGSGVDYNRAGVPLMEIVTAFPPDIEDPDEAREYLVQLRQVLLYLGVCDGKMEEGSLRCEPNISVRPAGQEKFGTKTELKNLNSFRSVQLGTLFERKRQIDVLEGGGQVVQETRGWNEQTESSFVMRKKESEQDYRYFPDPDLVPLEFSEDEIEAERAALPELPLAKARRYQDSLGLSAYDAGVLTADRTWAEFFEAAVAQGGDAKQVCNWMNGDFAKLLNEAGQTAVSVGEAAEGQTSKVRPGHIVELTKMIDAGTISGKIAKDVFSDMFKTGEAPSELVKAKGLTQISDPAELSAVCEEVVRENAAQADQYRAGKESLLGFFVGQVMKKTQGRANPAMVQDALIKALGQP
ncbi:MAG: Asp-tRNA(Asn)/Glu-tRNA(Gln) amidotransferase subunit GatB [Fimbriimonadaceae bacterium]|nr:Asp-tRNA(Asn)/Glu-tRNA(Gln) amidotransferase subunit GatB [Fimbriimonadaceae bacterium]